MILTLLGEAKAMAKTRIKKDRRVKIAENMYWSKTACARDKSFSRKMAASQMKLKKVM